MSTFITIESDGPLITATNFWETAGARAGKCFVSPNAGAVRLLIPACMETCLNDMRAARECVISRGAWPDQRIRDAFEILFDDASPHPFALFVTPASFDRLPLPGDAGREFTLSVWTLRDDRPHKALERPCSYRLVPRIPYLQPRGNQ